MVLRNICFEREIVVEAMDEEQAKIEAKAIASNLVFNYRYPTEYDVITVREAQPNQMTTEETLSRCPAALGRTPHGSTQPDPTR